MIDTKTASVTSADGTTIGYRQLGQGPGLVILHGMMESAHSHIQLAEALADSFTVYLPDRRGRGLSGAHRTDYRIEHDIEDLDALLTATGAHNVFAVSAGAIILLHAAVALPAIHRAAVFEPPLFSDTTVPNAALTRFDQEMADGRTAAALVTAMKAAQMGPAVFNVIPRRLLEGLTTLAMAQDDKNTTDGYVPMRALASTLHYDLRLVADTSGRSDDLRAVPQEVLLLGGSKSPAYLKNALNLLEKVLPRAQRVEFPGLNHGGSGNRNRGGQPERVAQELRRFFLPTASTDIVQADDSTRSPGGPYRR